MIGHAMMLWHFALGCARSDDQNTSADSASVRSRLAVFYACNCSDCCWMREIAPPYQGQLTRHDYVH